MRILSLNHDVFVSNDGCATALLVLDASPARLRTLTATPLVKAMLAHYDDRVPEPCHLKPQIISI